MVIALNVPDEWGEKLDELAKQDGHSSRAAVIRKIVKKFFAGDIRFSSVCAGQRKKQAPKESQK